MMKRLSLPLLALGLVFAIISGCSEPAAEKTTPSEPTPQTEVETPSPEKTIQTVPEPTPPKEMKVDVSEALELMEEEPELQVLDVRTPEEVAGGTIKGARIVNIHDAEFDTRTAKTLDKTKPVLVYCGSGKRSSTAIARMKEQGFTMLYNLDGGITAWSAAGQEVVK